MTVVGRTMYPVQSSMDLINRMQTQFNTLQTQLATGQKASNLAELGSDRYFDLSIRSRLSRLDGYSTNITVVNSRLDMFDQLTTRLSALQQDARGLITPNSYGSQDIVLGAVPTQAASNLDEVVNILNSDINGRYLFGGSVTDAAPVTDPSTILYGASGKAGFQQVMSERAQADLGDGLGRLTIGGTAPNVSLTEDGNHPFGFKLSTISASSSAVTVTSPTGTPPQSLNVQFTGVPIAGDSVTLGLTLPDGTSDGIVLKAVTGTPDAGEFQIGPDAATTAANFSTALQASLQTHAKTTLTAASNNEAAVNFFNGHGQTVQRVQPSPDFAHATTLVAADPTTTVMWYKGGDSANPRSSIQARVDDSQTVNYGAQANESGTLTLVRSLAVLASQTFSTSDPNVEGRFDAIANRNIQNLSVSNNSTQGSIAMLSIELSNAKVQVGDIKSRHADYSSQMQGLLGGIEKSDDNEVAVQIAALQTRLQATYQTTSLISKLSLVNYLK
jgi:flagellin-like hook-associated protein FlgL